MDGQGSNLERLLQAHVLPGLSAVCRFVDAVSPGNAIARIGFTRANPDDVGIALSDLHVAD